MSQGNYTGYNNCETQVGNGSYNNIANLVIQSVPNNTVVIDCGSSYGHFRFGPSNILSVTLNGLTLVNGNQQDGNGGCVYASGLASLTVQNSVFQNCQTSNLYGSGGAIYVDFPASILDSNFSLNSAARGGALYLAASASVSKCLIFNNNAPLGGGVYINNSSASITNTNITNNSASQGGGVYLNSGNSTGSLDFVGTTISNNTATLGGGLYAVNADYAWNIYGATFAYNNATTTDPNVACNTSAAKFCESCDAKDCSSGCPVSNNQSCSQISDSAVRCYTTQYSTCDPGSSCTCGDSGLPKAAKILIILIAICLFVGVVLIVADVVRHFIRKNQKSGYTPIK